MKTRVILLALTAQLAAFGQDTPPVQAERVQTLTYSDTAIVEFPDVDPEFVGGWQSLNAFVAANLRYPEEARDQSYQGAVYVIFVVEKDGRCTNPRIDRGVHRLLDAEAKRLVLSMPNWIPAEHNDAVVRSLKRLPINFNLD